MDNYGCLTISKKDADLVLEELKKGPVVFSLSGDQTGAMIVSICQAQQIGVMPFGGNPAGRYFISVLGWGSHHFSTSEYEPAYFEEKLDLPICESTWISQFWQLMWAKG